MDIEELLLEARAERDAVVEAIITLERLACGRGKRRGRPPKWLAEMRSHNNDREAASAQMRQEQKLKVA